MREDKAEVAVFSGRERRCNTDVSDQALMQVEVFGMHDSHDLISLSLTLQAERTKTQSR